MRGAFTSALLGAVDAETRGLSHTESGGQLEFKSGEDIYDLSYMAPGFEIDNFVVFWYAWTQDVCEGWASDATPKKAGDSVGYETNGYYRFYKKTNTKLVVDWRVDHCAWRWLGVFKVDDWYNSGYSIQVCERDNRCFQAHSFSWPNISETAPGSA